MKSKVYNKKVIHFVWKNMITSFFVAHGPPKLGLSAKKLVIVFSHTESITYKYCPETYSARKLTSQYYKNRGLIVEPQ
jgi:hypothetical protein